MWMGGLGGRNVAGFAVGGTHPERDHARACSAACTKGRNPVLVSDIQFGVIFGVPYGLAGEVLCRRVRAAAHDEVLSGML